MNGGMGGAPSTSMSSSSFPHCEGGVSSSSSSSSFPSSSQGGGGGGGSVLQELLLSSASCSSATMNSPRTAYSAHQIPNHQPPNQTTNFPNRLDILYYLFKIHV